MMGLNIRFKAVILKIVPKLSLLPLLIWRTVMYKSQKVHECKSELNFFFFFDIPTTDLVIREIILLCTKKYFGSDTTQ